MENESFFLLSWTHFSFARRHVKNLADFPVVALHLMTRPFGRQDDERVATCPAGKAH